MYKELRDKTVMITGATGLIGQSLVRKLIDSGANIVSVVRDIDKARKMFGIEAPITYLVSDVTEIEVKRIDIDYFIHAASITSSKAFINDPVDVINTAYEGTKRTLEIARLSDVKGYIYLSSMEVYGTPTTDEKIDEFHGSNLDTMKPRSAYPESKRMCESLCASYASQYGVPTKVVRLTQTFGPGVNYNDGRVFAEFARCVIEGRDIVLHTNGETKRNYLYTEDAADAILTVLLKGEVGEAYNAANEETYCSILDLACLYASKSNNHPIEVRIEIEPSTSRYGYAPTLKMNLSTQKLLDLGWRPCFPLSKMIDYLLMDMKDIK